MESTGTGDSAVLVSDDNDSRRGESEPMEGQSNEADRLSSQDQVRKIVGSRAISGLYTGDCIIVHRNNKPVLALVLVAIRFEVEEGGTRTFWYPRQEFPVQPIYYSLSTVYTSEQDAKAAVEEWVEQHQHTL